MYANRYRCVNAFNGYDGHNIHIQLSLMARYKYKNISCYYDPYFVVYYRYVVGEALGFIIYKLLCHDSLFTPDNFLLVVCLLRHEHITRTIKIIIIIIMLTNIA